jgi:hypothetical protein
VDAITGHQSTGMTSRGVSSYDSTTVVQKKSPPAERDPGGGIVYPIGTTYPTPNSGRNLPLRDLEFIFLTSGSLHPVRGDRHPPHRRIQRPPSITKAEQRSIWVGMAKEPAHQLGTPIVQSAAGSILSEQDPTRHSSTSNGRDGTRRRAAHPWPRGSRAWLAPDTATLRVSTS